MRVVRTALLAVVALVVAMLAIVLPASAAGENYVALGDSYSSGTGAGDYGDSGSCKRSANSYAQLWANSHDVSSFTFVACSGAVTSDVLSSQVNSLSADTNFVTISIGGNDAGFTDVMIDCTLGSDDACVDRVNEAADFAQTTLAGRLDDTYAAIRSAAPSAQVVVLGYPHFYQVPGSCSVGLSDVKRTAIDGGADTLDGVISDRASAAGFTFVDVRGAFSGHEICSDDVWLHSVTVPVDESYHPTAQGQSGGYYAALNSAT
jgi:lysophospholipase L1-like esterase